MQLSNAALTGICYIEQNDTHCSSNPYLFQLYFLETVSFRIIASATFMFSTSANQVFHLVVMTKRIFKCSIIRYELITVTLILTLLKLEEVF